MLLTADDHAPIGPRLSPDLSLLAFTTTTRTWQHWSGSRLRVVDWRALGPLVTAEYARRRSGKGGSAGEDEWVSALRLHTSTVVELVHRPRAVTSFPGLYPPLGLLPPQPWLGNSHLLLSSYWRHSERLLIINVLTSAITALPPPAAPQLADGSATILHCHGSRLTVALSTPVTPTEVWLLEVSRFKTDSVGQWVQSFPREAELGTADGHPLTPGAEGDGDRTFVRWTQITQGARCADERVQRRVSSMQWDVLHVQPEEEDGEGAKGSYTDLPFDALLVYPTFAGTSAEASTSLPPLHLVPHGGPHASYTSCWSMAVAFLAACNFAVVLPNYRGSTAYGHASLSSLPGRCGSQDVRDCMAALAKAKAVRGDALHPTKVGVMGGSHGGFLTTHLIGQYPTAFYCASTRNPVVNVAAMAALTDIPDWCWYEVGLDYDVQAVPDPATYAHMLEASPMRHAGRVQTPLLLLLGSADRRVPMQQAIDYGRVLRGRGVTVGMLVYPEAQHGLNDKVSQESDVWVNTALWMFERYGADDSREQQRAATTKRRGPPQDLSLPI